MSSVIAIIPPPPPTQDEVVAIMVKAAKDNAEALRMLADK